MARARETMLPEETVERKDIGTLQGSLKYFCQDMNNIYQRAKRNDVKIRQSETISLRHEMWNVF